MLPLANQETMNLLGLTWDDMVNLCRGATNFMRYVIDKVQDEPAIFGLPDECPAAPRKNRNEKTIAVRTQPELKKLAG